MLITLDTVRADRLGCYGHERIETPHLDRIAREGILFENAFSSVPSTLPSHASILTGMYPARHGIHDNGVYYLEAGVETLAERLRAEDYATAAFVSAFVLDAQFGLDQGFELFDDQMELALSRSDPRAIRRAAHLSDEKRRWFAQLASPSERRADSVTQAAMDWLRALDSEPFFLWLHYFDAHQPYRPPEPWDTAYDPGYAGVLDGFAHTFKLAQRRHGWARDAVPAAEIAHMQARYDGEISFLDQWIGRLLGLLEQRDMLERSLVVVVGDHGEGFGEHLQIWEHNAEIYDEAVRVPLLVRLPGGEQRGRRIADLVRTVDVAPTVLDLLGLTPWRYVDGTSLRALIEGTAESAPAPILLEARRERQVHETQTSSLGLRTEDHKLILTLDRSGRVVSRELFDLKEDPGERRTLTEREPARTRAMTRELLARQEELERQRDALPFRGLDRMTSDALRALGYLDP